jgi:hypothetical protein
MGVALSPSSMVGLSLNLWIAASVKGKIVGSADMGLAAPTACTHNIHNMV